MCMHEIQRYVHSSNTKTHTGEEEAKETVGYKLTVTLPENVTGMDDLDVEVSAHKVCY